MTIRTPKIDCWDYTFEQSGTDPVWIARPEENGNTVSYTPDNFWQFIMIADTEEEIRSEVNALAEKNNLQHELVGMRYEHVPLADVLTNWRFMRYRGKSICVFETSDMTPTSGQSFPYGPPAPVRNGFIYLCYDRATGKPLGHSVGDDVVPFAEATIPSLISGVTELFEMTTEHVLINCMIVAANLMAASMEHPLIFWRGDIMPLHELMLLNPNHNPEDPEESLLDSID